MLKTSFLLACLTAGSLLPAAAQYNSNTEPNVEVIVGDRGSRENVELEFINNAPKIKRIQGVPRFAIVGKEDKFYLGIGTQFLGEGVYDWGAEMPLSYAFIPSTMTPAAPGDGSQFRFSCLTSAFYINAVAMPGTRDRVGLFFRAEINNGGDSYGFDVFHFYITYRDFLVGYTSTLFNDGEAMPFTIDYQGPNGSAQTNLFTADFIKPFGKGFTAAIGVEQPNAAMTGGGYARQVKQRSPAFPAYLQYAWGQNGHIRLSGLFRPMQYRNLIEESNKTLAGAGVQLSGFANVSPALTVYWGATYGAGIANYMQDDEGLNVDAVPMGPDGKLKMMKTFGITGALTYNINSRLSVNGVYSHLLNSRPDGADFGGDHYRYGDYVAANLFYRFNKIIGAGVEYDYGFVRHFDGSALHSNRLQAQLSVSF